MKKSFLKIIPLFALTILSAKILNWFFNFSDTTNNIINSLMFTLIGVSFLIFSFNFKNTLFKIIVIVCGLFLMIWNFLPEKNYLTFIGILAIVIPMLIGKFSEETKEIMLG